MECMEEAMVMPGVNLTDEIRNRLKDARNARIQQSVLFDELAAIQEELERRVSSDGNRHSGGGATWKKPPRGSSS
jgi:hypothetical protein